MNYVYIMSDLVTSKTDLNDLKIRYPKIDFDIFQTLIDDGYSSYKIAKQFSLPQKTAWRIIQKIRHRSSNLNHFKDNRSNYLASIHSKSILLQDRIYDHFIDMSDDVFNRLTSDTKRALLHTTGINANNIYNQERLEGDLSTSNTSVLDLVEERKRVLEERAKLKDQGSDGQVIDAGINE